jgi:hypothetical protein
MRVNVARTAHYIKLGAFIYKFLPQSEASCTAVCADTVY